MRKLSIVILLIFIAIALSGCSDADKAPRVEICKSHWTLDTICIPLRENYKFDEVPYSIEETEQGYNIIIYCIKGE